MKILFKKIKNSNKVTLVFYLISLIAYIIGYIFIFKSLLSLVGIETTIRVIVLIVLFLWLLFYFLFGLTSMIIKKYKKFIILTIINILLIFIMFFTSIIINKIYNNISLISNQDYTTYTTNLIALKDNNLKNDSVLGMINNKEDIEGYILANTMKNKENINQEVKYYDDYYEMLNDLYTKKIDAIFVSSNYGILFSGEEAYQNIVNDTKILFTYSEKLRTNNMTNTNKKLTDPFTILIMGVDSEVNGLNNNAAFNGDTLMLITFNPKNLSATIFSIPRDTYVPISCNNNRYNKINSSAAYGTECVINTVKNLVDVNIDYYAKINFNGVIDLVNAVGGIDVDVEEPNYSVYVSNYGKGNLCESNSLREMNNLVCMNTGWQHLNGEQALAYARNRHGFLESDLARNRHQQQIVEALAKKMVKLNNFNDFEKLLNTISKNIITNLSTNQLLSFYQTLKDMLIKGIKENEFINIQKTYLEVYNLPVNIGGMTLSALGYYDNSLEEIKKALKVNLGLIDEEMIKTFNYDYNEEYTSPIIGKGITQNKTNIEVLPNFVGSSVSSVEEWTSNRGITLYKEFLGCTENTPGVIGRQSVYAGTNVNNITSLTIYINGSCDINPSPNNIIDNTDQTNDNNKEDDINIPGIPNNDDNNNNNQINNNDDITNVIPGLDDLPTNREDDNINEPESE